LKESFSHKISVLGGSIVSLLENKLNGEETKPNYPIKQKQSFPFIKKNEETISKQSNCLIDLSDNKNNTENTEKSILDLIDFQSVGQKEVKESSSKKNDKGFSFINKTKEKAKENIPVSVSNNTTNTTNSKVIDLDKLYAENKENNVKYNFNVNSFNYHQNSYISVADLASNHAIPKPQNNFRKESNKKEEQNPFPFIEELVRKKF